jgi:uncharacterized protein YjbI with pentapeptide repeats
MTGDWRLPMMSWTRFGRVCFLSALLAFAAGAQECPAVSPPSGRDFRNKVIDKGNFSYQDLTNANFSGATLIAPYFAYANLTNANFQGATFRTDTTNPATATDFSFANLEKTCFIGARFEGEGSSYFTNATLTCADFSKVDLSRHNVIFGDGQLTFNRGRQDCRLAFRRATMDCEFMKDWRYMDLAQADIKACVSQLAGQDFTGAKLDEVNLEGANLNGTKFVGANLNLANLKQASLIGADLSNARLLGARLNSANLTNASLYNAVLSNDTGSGIANAATLRQAHLKNANLSFAKLSGVDLGFANFYGKEPAGAGICQTRSMSQCGGHDTQNYEGFACDCASAHGATLRETDFSGAYLYGVDFTSADMQGVRFAQAILTGANFNGASISPTPSGTVSNFSRAFLQGTNLDGARITNTANFFGAFVDFSEEGNNIYILLDGKDHNTFACDNCSPPSESPVCVYVTYSLPTRVPKAGVPLDCPNGAFGDCGKAEENGSNKNWQSPFSLPQAWYRDDSTYIKAPADRNSVCNPGTGAIPPIRNW